MSRTKDQHVLALNAGELVQVRSKEEILRTLDARGTLDALPFMPEMLQYCGQQFRVFKSAHKTCDTIERPVVRRMMNAVHLEGLRCDGQSHGGCQAGCLLFWKEAWLKRVPTEQNAGLANVSTNDGENRCTEDTLWDATRIDANSSDVDGETFRCQATELLKATTPLAWWDMRQYVRDVRSGNVNVSEVIRGALFWIFSKLLKIGGYRALIWTYNKIQEKRGGIPYPFRTGKLVSKTPVMALNLQPRELVQVKTHDEILETLNQRNRNRGLSFDVEMVKYCGEKHRVLRRVERIINEKTGKMMHMPNDCIILEGVTCCAHFSQGRLFCPRSIYPYWREIWLKRVESATDARSEDEVRQEVSQCGSW